MNEKSGTFELLEPASPEALIPDSQLEPWMPAAAILSVMVVLALLAWFAFRKRKSAHKDPRNVRHAAFTEATAALETIGAVGAREAAVQASLILRKYLSIVARDPALFETHEEYVSRHEALKDFSEEARGSATLGFSRLAAIKYAPQSPDMNTEQVISGSHKLLATLHQGLRA